MVRGILLHQGEAGLAGAVAQECGKGGGDRAFVVKIEMAEALQFVVVGLDGFMGGFEVEGGHGRILAIFKRG